MASGSYRQLILERLQAFFPDLNLDDPVLKREVMDPLVEYVGAEVPDIDEKALLLDRLSEIEGLDGSVLAELSGKVAAYLARFVRTETRSAIARRRLDDDRLLSGRDREESRDFFFVGESYGTYATGTLRAYFRSPQMLLVDATMPIRVPGRDGGRERIFWATGTTIVTPATMRAQREGNSYYADIPVRASAPGQYYTLRAGEASGTLGIPGATRVTNREAFSRAEDADSSSTFLARIRQALVLRSIASSAGAEHALVSAGFAPVYLAKTGDPLMVRDRVYGVSAISGVPGGYISDTASISPYEWVSVGNAWDAWTPAENIRLVPVRLNNLRDEGFFIKDLGRGEFVELDGSYFFRTQRPRLRDEVPDLDLFAPPLILDDSLYSPNLVGPDDVLVFEGELDPFTGIRYQFPIVALESDTLVEIEVPGESSWDSLNGTIRFARAMRRNTGRVSALMDTTYRWFSVPLHVTELKKADGSPLTTSGAPVVEKPGTTYPERASGALVPQTTNVLESFTHLPLVRVDRLQMTDALTEEPESEYVYRAEPLFVEFLSQRLGLSASSGTAPVTVRCHLPGPQAAAFGPSMRIGTSMETRKYLPLCWPEASYTVTPPSGVDAAETGRIVLSGLLTSTPLKDFTGATAYGETGPRLMREGDWVILTPADESLPIVALPIEEVDSSTSLTVYAANLPVGQQGRCRVIQGTSRAVQKATGRGEEGTYFFDVLVALDLPSGVPTSDQPPPAQTPAVFSRDDYHCQGFDLVSSTPSLAFSTSDRPTLMVQHGYVVDGDPLENRSVVLYAPSGKTLRSVQELIDKDPPVVSSGMAKQFPPSYLTAALYYEAPDLSARRAATLIEEALEALSDQQAVEISDLVSVLTDNGATYVVTGRAFVARQDHLRRWDRFASKGSIPLFPLSTVVPEAIRCVRLGGREAGSEIDHMDPDNQIDSYLLRHGGFGED